MKLGLQIPSFTWPVGAKEIGPTLVKIARTADQGGFDPIGVMDHFFQIGSLGPPEQEMLEAYTTLGYLAANTSRARLVTVVTGAVYRYPGVIAKIVTTLDVLKRHCEREKRNYDDIEKTCMFRFDVGGRAENVSQIVEQLRGLSRMGFTTAIGGVKDVWKITPLEIIAREIIPAVAAF